MTKDHNFRAIESRFQTRALSLMLTIVGTVLGKTWRVSVKHPDSINPFADADQPLIYAFWHSQLLPLAYCCRNSKKTAVISSSNDGHLAARVAMSWGHDVIFGSSSKGGTEVIRRCLSALQKNGSIVITPDGPRGPKEIAKAGVVSIATLSGAPVVPILVKADKCWRLKSWDAFMIPKPFTKVALHFKEPLYFEKKRYQQDELEELRLMIQKELCVNE